ncbi:MAG: hypothetical protein LBQ51_06375 [Desulfovibrio sp.]|jgi:hypothetical protein|nr:hypothetical protein [Desulfovibrio sp.]
MNEPEKIIVVPERSSSKLWYVIGGFIAGVAGTVAAAFLIDGCAGGASSSSSDEDDADTDSEVETAQDGAE